MEDWNNTKGRSKMKKVILGAGIAGLGAYYADNAAEIYEASDKAGGICHGFQIGEFYFDQAVHLSFTKDRIVRDVFDRTEQLYHKPLPYSWYKETWIRHPAQNNLFPFPVQFKIDAIKGFIERKGRENVDSFKDWLIGGYGEYLYDNLFSLYNGKYWQTDLGQMGIGWIGNRIYMPNIDEMLYGAFTDETSNVYYANEMRYPQNGGYYSFFSEIADKADMAGKLHLCKKAIHIDTKAKTVTFEDNTVVCYEKLYSSIPLPQLIDIIGDVPDNIREMSSRLENTGVALVSMGLNTNNFEKLWFYIYDTDIMSARANMPSVKSPNNVPEGRSSIQFEIYFSSKSHAPDQSKAIDNCIYALEKLGVARKENILFTDYRIMPYGNVTLLKSTEQETPIIRDWIMRQGIIPIGRFGKWEYLWSDEAFLSGYKNCSCV